MIANLNLASQPFRNRTLPWTITVIVAGASLLALFFIIAESRRTSALADVIERDLQGLRKERAVLEAQAAEVRQAVPPDQLRILEAAHLLVDHKRFSWSKLFVDLESSLPGSVRVSRINVRDVSQRGGQTRAELDLTLVGRTPVDVTGMISEMNRTGIFSAVPLSQKPQTGKGESGVEWALRINYAQRRGGAPPANRTGNESTNVASAATLSTTSTSEAQP